MSTSSDSSHHKLLEAINNLHHCLSDPNCIIQEYDRIKLNTNFLEFKRRLHSSVTQFDSSSNSNFTTEDNQVDFVSKQFTQLLNTFNISSTSLPELDSRSRSTPSNQLEHELTMALLCFFLFEENAVLKKKDLIYWWVGLGLIDAEEAADGILNKLIEVDAIEQVVNSERQKICNKYKLAMKISTQLGNRKVGLLRKEGTKFVVSDLNGATIDENSRGSIETLFNPGVSILTIRYDWLRKMKNLKVLHLGRWSSDPEQHIEVENLEFLEALKYLKEMRFVSLKGVSRIMELSDEICRLGKLRVLDLQACPNLEALPKRIGMLTNLTHLDVSECYLLDRIPKGVTSLTKLQVLKGFVIGDVRSSSSCKFKDLANHLGSTLKKLSIRTRKISFPNEDDLKAFAKFGKLLRLKIVWVRVSDSDDDDDEEEIRPQEATLNAKVGLNSRSFVRNLTKTFRLEPICSGLPEQLEKLEVQAIPQRAVKMLMLSNSEKLESLNKLYVIGGEVSDLTNRGKIKWKIKTLRLKHLTRLHMNWRQFKGCFPCVSYLEVTRCPFLSFFPCDYHGIWRPA